MRITATRLEKAMRTKMFRLAMWIDVPPHEWGTTKPVALSGRGLTTAIVCVLRHRVAAWFFRRVRMHVYLACALTGIALVGGPA